MRRVRFFAILSLLALSLITAGSVAAKPGGPGRGNGNGGPKPARATLTWSVPRVEQTVAPGTTAQVTVTFTSSADLTNLSLAAPGGLGRIMTVTPSTFASVKAGTPTSVTLTFTVPAENARCQGGVLKARAGNKNVPHPLNVKVTVPGVCEAEAED